MDTTAQCFLWDLHSYIPQTLENTG
jgi:hypothetical protein